MLDKLAAWFDRAVANQAASTTNTAPGFTHKGQLAAAALMVEIMVIDQQIDDAEQRTICHQLQQQFALSTEEANELMAVATSQVDQATSLYQFTRIINDHFDATEKTTLLENLWRVAFADKVLDKHEEAMIRRVAELIHVPHSQFIAAKHRSKETSKNLE